MQISHLNNRNLSYILEHEREHMFQTVHHCHSRKMCLNDPTSQLKIRSSIKEDNISLIFQCIQLLNNREEQVGDEGAILLLSCLHPIVTIDYVNDDGRTMKGTGKDIDESALVDRSSITKKTQCQISQNQ